MNNFGNYLKVTIFGASHKEYVGVTIDGCLPGIKISPDDFTCDLQKRKAGRRGTTARIEDDVPQIVSGISDNITTGSTIKILFKNKNIKSSDYNFVKDIPRPGHADFVAFKKYGIDYDYSGGGIFSGRMTVGLVAAGVIAKKICNEMLFNAELISVNGSKNIQQEIDKAVDEGDSVGGIIECRIKNVPVGLGMPFFDSVESLISHIVFAIPGIKGIEFGSGFKSAEMKGSQHNDIIIDKEGTTATNNAGGINGGITNGNDIAFRVAVKPSSSIAKPQKTYNFKTNKIEELSVKGRHDACFALRVPPIVEAVAAIALANCMIERDVKI